MKHIKEIDLSIKIDIRQDSDEENAGRASYDWFVQGGVAESDRFFHTATEAEIDAVDRLEGVFS